MAPMGNLLVGGDIAPYKSDLQPRYRYGYVPILIPNFSPTIAIPVLHAATRMTFIGTATSVSPSFPHLKKAWIICNKLLSRKRVTCAFFKRTQSLTPVSKA